MENCGNCKYYQDYNIGNNKGECHKNAPEIYEADRSQLNRFESAWPPITSQDFCGEWEMQLGE